MRHADDQDPSLVGNLVFDTWNTNDIKFQFTGAKHDILLNSIESRQMTTTGKGHFIWLLELITYLEITRILDTSSKRQKSEQLHRPKVKFERWNSIQWISNDPFANIDTSRLYICNPGTFGYKDNTQEISLVAVLELITVPDPSAPPIYLIVLSKLKSSSPTPTFSMLLVYDGLMLGLNVMDSLRLKASLFFGSRQGRIDRMIQQTLEIRDSIDYK